MRFRQRLSIRRIGWSWVIPLGVPLAMATTLLLLYL
jgi:hypothetical protein